jgi:hypothetical protein
MPSKGAVKAGERFVWRPLTEWPEAQLSHGTVFRCLKAAWPYEATVDFMLIDYLESASGCALMVTTGYKAGLTLVLHPADAGARGVLSTRWLIEHWSEWAYPECPVTSVLVVRHYPAAVSIEGAAPEPSRDIEV